MINQSKNKNHAQAFVRFIIERTQKDKAMAAALRRADNPATEYQSWEYLASFNIDLDKPYKCLPHATVSAAIAKAKIDKNGNAGIGQALASCYDNGNNSAQAKAKLRRLLTCDSVEEVCRILRPLFSLIESKGSRRLDFSQLLSELLDFHWKSQIVKARWAQSFYDKYMEEEETA